MILYINTVQVSLATLLNINKLQHMTISKSNNSQINTVQVSLATLLNIRKLNKTYDNV